MIKKTITYSDFNGTEVTKDFYFHLTQVDMVEISIDGSFEEKIRKAAVTGDKSVIFLEFKRLIAKSVGMRSEDGADFIRTESFTNAFLSSPAFDELIMELFTSPDQGVGFIRGLLPAKMQDALKKELDSKEKDGAGSTVNPFEEKPVWERENREPTGVELRSMTREQFQKLWTQKTGVKIDES